MAKANEPACPACLRPAGEHGHLCVPLNVKDETCDWCGSLIPNQRHLYSDKVREISFICNSCGRTAVSADHLCKPEKIK
jgi:hypothetical protein